MKRIILSGTLVLIAGSLAWLAYLFWPKTVDFEAQGMKYRLGAVGAPEERLLNVRIKGKIYRDNFRGDRRFHGTIELEGEELPVPERYREADFMKFRGFHHYFVWYPYADSFGRAQQYVLGNLFMNDGVSRIAITLYEPEEGGSGWSSDKGLMVAAPASNRDEALAVSNELMREFLNGYELK